MSYCRYSEESDVYVYYSTNDTFVCCGCFRTEDIYTMIKHLETHIIAGDKVPEYALKRLLKEANIPC